MHTLRIRIGELFNGDQAQDSLEYLAATGAVVTALAIALIAGFALLLPEIVGLACPSVDTAVVPASAPGTCLGP